MHHVVYCMGLNGHAKSFHCVASFFPEICLVLCLDPHKHTLWRHQYLICILEETWISLGGKKILKKEKRHPSLLWKAFSISLFFNSLIFHFIGTCIGTCIGTYCTSKYDINKWKFKSLQRKFPTILQQLMIYTYVFYNAQ